MIVHGRCACDLCGQYMGQLWNEPSIAPDLLPSDDFRVCDDCHSEAVFGFPPVVNDDLFGDVA